MSTSPSTARRSRAPPQLPDRWKRAIEETNEAWATPWARPTSAVFPARDQAEHPAAGEEPRRRLRQAHRRARPGWRPRRRQGQGKARDAEGGRRLPRQWHRLRGAHGRRAATPSATPSAPSCFEYQHELEKLGTPVDRGEWGMTPQAVNAVQPARHERPQFPGRASCRRPSSTPTRRRRTTTARSAPSSATRSATASTTRERSSTRRRQLHQLVDGRRSCAFPGLGAALVAQFDAYKPFPDLAINGQQTLSENIADLAGLSVAYDAWRCLPRRRQAPPSGRVHAATSSSSSASPRPGSPRSRSDAPAGGVSDGHAPERYRA